MFAQPVWRVLSSTRHSRCSFVLSKSLSTAAPDFLPYHPKVRAIPFAFSPEDAIRQVGPAVSLLRYPDDNESLNVSLKKILSSFLAYAFPVTGCEPPHPSRIQALYFPTWFVDAEIKARTIYSKTEKDELDESGRRKGSTDESAVVHLDNVYLPGYTMDVGRIVIRNPPTDCDLAQPFTPDLTEQWGQDVMCLPFNTVPFDLIELAHELDLNDAVITDNVRFIPESVQANLVAAYPVLLPVYLLQYGSQEFWPPMTVIMTAHNTMGVYHIYITHPYPENKVQLTFEELFPEDEDGYIEGHIRVGKPDVDASLIGQGESKVSEELSSWLSNKLYARDAPLLMRSRFGRPIKMDDHRVREWTTEEVNRVHTWMETGRQLAFVRSVTKELTKELKRLKRTVNSWQPFSRTKGVNGDIARQESDSQSEFAENIEASHMKELNKLEAHFQEQRAAQLPDWWVQWEANEVAKREKEVGNASELSSSTTNMKEKSKTGTICRS